MKKICYVTSTRAEFGTLRNLLKKLYENENFQLSIVATGMHLSSEFGYTYKEILDAGLQIDEKIETLLSSDTESSMTKCMALTLLSFAEYFQRKRPDILLVSGDRYEMFAVCIAAYNQRIPIAHIHGGEITEGALDDAYRHAMSKLSLLHFTTSEEHRYRVIQMGENPQNVYNVGSLSVENANSIQFLSKSELESDLNFDLGEKYFVVTYHPETLSKTPAKEQIQKLLSALDEFPQYKILFTKANSDAEGRMINEMISKYEIDNSNRVKVVDSLGVQRYLSAVKNCDAVVGNSSSGIVEAPALYTPTVDIGCRQKGRSCSDSVIHCTCEKEEIVDAIRKVVSLEFNRIVRNAKNPYGNGNTSDQIISILNERMKYGIGSEKKFYDVKYIKTDEV